MSDTSHSSSQEHLPLHTHVVAMPSTSSSTPATASAAPATSSTTPQTLPMAQAHILAGASSGFALPSSKLFPGKLLVSISPFTSSGSPSSSPESTPLGTPTAELQKLSLGVERYARAIEDPGLTGSFSGTVPLPTLSHQASPMGARRRPSHVLMDPIMISDHGVVLNSGSNAASSSTAEGMGRRSSSGIVAALETGVHGGNAGSGGGITLTSIKRAFTGRRAQNQQGQQEHPNGTADDLEANIRHAKETPLAVDMASNTVNEKLDLAQHPRDRDEMIDGASQLNTAELTGEGMRRRKPKGGVLSHLLRLQHNQAAAAAAAETSGKEDRRDSHGATSADQRLSIKHLVAKKPRRGFYVYRSRNNSVTSLKGASASPSITTTPKVSPRSSVVFDTSDAKRKTNRHKHQHHDSDNDDKSQNDRHHKPLRRKKSSSIKDVDNRSIHRDIAEILTRQSFLIMMAKALILYGAPSHRIEETCALLAVKMDVDATFNLLPGSMTISFSDPETHTSDTRHFKCSQGMDMNKLAGVHRIALAVLKGQDTIEKANWELEQLTLEPNIFPLWLTLLGWMGSSAFVAPLAFGGGGWDMLLAGCCGLMVGVLGIVASKIPVYGNVFEMTASILVGFIAKAFGDRVCFSAVALAGVVVLLPGLLLTQAIMELSSRNIVSGAVRMFYALMYAFFLGFGLTIGAELWDYITGGPTTVSTTACQHPISQWWYFIVYPAVSASINIVFNAHPRQWFGMTFVTAVGLVVTLFLKSGPQITAAIAAFAVGITGQVYGRLTGQLSYVPLLSGVLLLVPGSVGVRGILAIIGSDPSQGFTFVLTMIHVSVAITLGVFCSALVCYPFWRRSTFMNF
ncbi:hypothetical protein EDD11_005237 [Mortierella claussenii]|nr:hypothetical protein EDD11_005237 [Mortierella claussenii]